MVGLPTSSNFSGVMMVSYSQLKDFRECRRLWYYKYHLHVEPKITPVRLALGTAIHAGIESYYGQTDNAFAAAFRESLLSTFASEHPGVELWSDEAWSEAYVLGLSVLGYYCAWAVEHDDFEVLATELDLAAELLPALAPYTGRLDGVARDRNGELWVLEYKTVDNFPPPGHLDFDLQSASYQWLLQTAISDGQLAWADPDDEVAGVIYTGLRKARPEPPSVNKNGTLSLAQRCTTYPLWLAKIDELGLSVDAYSDKLQALLSQPDPVVYRERHRRERFELAQVAEELRLAYTECSQPDVAVYRTPTRWCGDRRYGCLFHSPCLASWRGGDEQGILELSYRPRSHRGTSVSLTEEIL